MQPRSRSTSAGAVVTASLTEGSVDVLVLALGYNDGGNPTAFRSRAQAVLAGANADHIIWLTLRRDTRNVFEYTAANQILHELADADARMSVLDWDAASRSRANTVDGLHLTATGAQLMNTLVSEAIGEQLAGADPDRQCRTPSNPVAEPDPATAAGYWLLTNDGEVHHCGSERSSR